MPDLVNIESPNGPPVEYKASTYNIFVEKTDVVLAFNSRSSTLASLTPTQYQLVQQILDEPHKLPDATDAVSLRQDLIHGQFLIPANFDESKWLRLKHRMNRYGSQALGLVIAPTLRCNFACEYCYVDLNANKMNDECRKKTKAFFHNKLHEKAAASVVFTGGDPSIAMDVVEDLSTSFIESCRLKESKYVAVLITNGYLLDDEMRAVLRRSQISNLQISVDGSREFHNKTRHLAGGMSTYDRVIQNIADTCNNIFCHVRINVDSLNYRTMPDLLDDLVARGLEKKILIYFAHLDSINENSRRYADRILSTQEYAALEPKLIREAIARGFTMSGRGMHEPVAQFCGANSSNYFVIDSNAQLLKCYQDFGSARTNGIGYIDLDGKEVITSQDNLMKWLAWDPWEIEECRNCKVLPLCMGGCSHKIMNSGMNIERGCIKLRFNVEQVAEIYHDAIRSGRSAQVRCTSCSASIAPNA